MKNFNLLAAFGAALVVFGCSTTPQKWEVVTAAEALNRQGCKEEVIGSKKTAKNVRVFLGPYKDQLIFSRQKAIENAADALIGPGASKFLDFWCNRSVRTGKCVSTSRVEFFVGGVKISSTQLSTKCAAAAAAGRPCMQNEIAAPFVAGQFLCSDQDRALILALDAAGVGEALEKHTQYVCPKHIPPPVFAHGGGGGDGSSSVTSSKRKDQNQGTKPPTNNVGVRKDKEIQTPAKTNRSRSDQHQDSPA